GAAAYAAAEYSPRLPSPKAARGVGWAAEFCTVRRSRTSAVLAVAEELPFPGMQERWAAVHHRLRVRGWCGTLRLRFLGREWLRCRRRWRRRWRRVARTPA